MSSVLVSHEPAGGRLLPDSWREPVDLNPALACLGQAQRVLMLQGPVGPFFDRVAQWLIGRGTQVKRVTFQGGDDRDCQALDPIRFTEAVAAWPQTLGTLLHGWRPDCIVLFGQSRIYHKVALERARALDIPCVVMEEGYFRPGYVTMELGGVNGYSTTLDRFVWGEPDAPAEMQPTGITPDISRSHFQKMAWHASQHYVAMRAEQRLYPHYQHHRVANPNFYARYWVRSWLRKGWHRGTDRQFQRWLFDSETPYFFVPLQLDGDSQITQHSLFPNNIDFVVRVIRSFAAHAPADSILVLRQHPHARGGTSHEPLIRGLASELKISARVHHMVEGDTPDLAQRSLGVVLINSTVGLQALERGAPLMVLGEAPYKRPDLTFAGELDHFWTRRRPPDPEAAEAFLAQVKNLTQAPASVYALRNESLGWSALM
ncbi:capsular biosynthesis protein [Caenimonas soli]|uniref:capsular biosynthesis protein n=1 Tax=Caenimonas soli TaxID=2735555 RepID=UPI0015551C44|nr:capsular biosynthesis protein [Caenimonas soli]NPC57181.1 capsular biosynthesis protein [Caenimonas soli]